MTHLDRLVLILPHFNGTFWAYFEIDRPEWTRPEYCHQN